MEGWIRLSRSIMDHWMWEDEPFDKARAWIDLIFLANWEDQKVAYKGEVITCKRGDVNFSINYLAERWHWSRHKVSDFLDLLEKDNMLEQHRTYHRTYLTIVNYDKFQCQPNEKDSKRTADRTAKGQQKDTINKVNKINTYIVLGEFQNVQLTEEEIGKLKERLPDQWEGLVEELSGYLAQTHKKYASHYATILNWARRRKEGASSTSKPKQTKKQNSFTSMEKQDYDFEALEKMLSE